MIGSEFLGSTVIASIVGYLSAKHTNSKDHRVKYITEERQNWRKNIKENVATFCYTDDKLERMRLKTLMVLSLNPCDDADKEIIECLEDMVIHVDNERIKRLEVAVSFLLKHDWERAKQEVGIISKEVDRKNKQCR